MATKKEVWINYVLSYIGNSRAINDIKPIICFLLNIAVKYTILLMKYTLMYCTDNACTYKCFSDTYFL